MLVKKQYCHAQRFFFFYSRYSFTCPNDSFNTNSWRINLLGKLMDSKRWVFIRVWIYVCFEPWEMYCKKERIKGIRISLIFMHCNNRVLFFEAFLIRQLKGLPGLRFQNPAEALVTWKRVCRDTKWGLNDMGESMTSKQQWLSPKKFPFAAPWAIEAICPLLWKQLFLVHSFHLGVDGWTSRFAKQVKSLISFSLRMTPGGLCCSVLFWPAGTAREAGARWQQKYPNPFSR